jgi:hypothetical protein
MILVPVIICQVHAKESDKKCFQWVRVFSHVGQGMSPVSRSAVGVYAARCFLVAKSKLEYSVLGISTQCRSNRPRPAGPSCSPWKRNIREYGRFDMGGQNTVRTWFSGGR